MASMSQQNQNEENINQQQSPPFTNQDQVPPQLNMEQQPNMEQIVEIIKNNHMSQHRQHHIINELHSKIGAENDRLIQLIWEGQMLQNHIDSM